MSNVPGSPAHTNLLAREKSPYLLQHAHNPVDWHPWGDPAFAKARAEDKPVFLSVGYSTCHWCHVMERESFENEEVGKFINEHFVAIKVDREERPDVDKIYMAFVQATTGGGGWPMNVFLTPSLKPFYGGTYFPPEPNHGRPSFLQLLKRIAELWTSQRKEIEGSADDVAQKLKAMGEHDAGNAYPAGLRELHGAGQTFLHEYDHAHGGFGGAPKFPRPSQPLFVLRHARRFHEADGAKAVVHTCDAMAAGGIHDLLGGGFARYSVDEKWLVPHFEKMLYDNAQLVQLYLDVHLVDGGARHAAVVRDTLGYVLRDLTDPEGGFYSAEDADSEGQEGKFYCWTLAELKSLLSPAELKAATHHWGITEKGNFIDHSHPHPLPGLNVLSVVHPDPSDAGRALLASARAKMETARAGRVRPHRDDKVLASWNGMMLGAFARAGAVLGEPAFLKAAERNAEFLRTRLWEDSTRSLYHRWRGGERDSVQLLEGHANVLAGMLDLYEATLEPRHLEFAVAVAESMMERFHDAVGGGFWQTTSDTPHLLMRVKDDYDGAEPSGNSVAALALLRMAAICDRPQWRAAAEKTVRLFAQKLHQMPQAVPHLFLALDFLQQEPKRVVLAGDPARADTAALLKAVHGVYEPNRVVSGTRGPVEEFARTLPAGDGFTQAYCCSGHACEAPTRDANKVREFLGRVPRE